MPEYKQNAGRSIFPLNQDFGVSTADNMLIVWQVGDVPKTEEGDACPTGCLMIDVIEAMQARICREIEHSGDNGNLLKKLQLTLGAADGILQELNSGGKFI